MSDIEKLESELEKKKAELDMLDRELAGIKDIRYNLMIDISILEKQLVKGK